MTKKKETQQKAAEKIQGSFSLSSFKKKKGFSEVSVKFKPQQWIPLSKAFQENTSLPGIPLGHIALLRGHSDSGKTTALLEAAVAAQKMNILPVFIITEMKWSWEHAMEMGLKVEEVYDQETGELVNYEGFFLYADRGSLHTIEDVAAYIADLIDEQTKGNLPYDLCFFWDSIGSVPCELSVRSQKNNNEWNSGAMSTQFGNNLNQKVLLSRKESYPYTNTLVAINKVWTMKPESPMGQPKLMNKGGMAMWFDASIIITFGNITNSGTSKIKATKNGKQVEFAKRTNIQIEKNHINGITTRGKIVMTPHGFIEDLPKAIESYKSQHRDKWLTLLGTTDFDLIEEGDMAEDKIINPEYIDGLD
jgi:RecA/RadA recombinase